MIRIQATGRLLFKLDAMLETSPTHKAGRSQWWSGYVWKMKGGEGHVKVFLLINMIIIRSHSTFTLGLDDMKSPVWSDKGGKR